MTQPMFKPYDSVILTQDEPSRGLKAGDEGLVVRVYDHPRRYEVEFLDMGSEGVSYLETCLVIRHDEAYKLRPLERISAS